jgi:hypothetical protein
MGAMIILYLFALVHVLRGVRYTFVLLLNLAIIQSMVCYIVYVYFYEVKKIHWKGWYFVSCCSFGMYHWLLSIRYFMSSREMPYALDQKEVPKFLA